MSVAVVAVSQMHTDSDCTAPFSFPLKQHNYQLARSLTSIFILLNTSGSYKFINRNGRGFLQDDTLPKGMCNSLTGAQAFIFHLRGPSK